MIGVEGRGGWVIPFSGYCDWSGGERGVGSFHFLATVMAREMGVSLSQW